MKYKLSRYWNRLVYIVLKIVRAMIWDQTGKNADLKKEPFDELAEAIFCNLKY